MWALACVELSPSQRIYACGSLELAGGLAMPHGPVPLVELSSRGFRDVPTRPGVYVAYWVRGGRPMRIPRVLGVDERGVLFIGSTKGLRGRLRRLWRGVQVARRGVEVRKYPHTLAPP